MVSALLGFMAVSGILGQRNLKSLRIKVFPVDDVFAKLPARLEVELENCRRWLPAFLISVEVGSGHVLVPILAPGKRQRSPLTLVLPSRGYQPLPPVWVRSCFPINFFYRSRVLELNQELLVFPQPLKALMPYAEGESQQARVYDVSQPGVDGELRSIDSYQQSDPLKSIHWKHSARHDEYKVKRLNRLGEPSLMLNFNDFNGELETRLGKCTFLVNQLIEQHRAVGLKLGKQILHPGTGRNQRTKLLTELALYGRR